MFEYEAKGKIRIVGCAGVSTENKYLVKFTVGSRVFIKKKAKLGKIESVVIKRHRSVMPRNPGVYGIQPNMMYTDTFNRMWSEDELVSQEEAFDLATLYRDKIKQEAKKLFEEGEGCLPIRGECGK